MFRAEIRQVESGPILKMEGRLVGQWAQEAWNLVSDNRELKTLLVDISEICYVDLLGEQFLTWLGCLGAKFLAENTYAMGVLERLQLPLFDKMPLG